MKKVNDVVSIGRTEGVEPTSLYMYRLAVWSSCASYVSLCR